LREFLNRRQPSWRAVFFPVALARSANSGGTFQTLSDQSQRERNALRVRLRDEQALDPLTFKFDWEID